MDLDKILNSNMLAQSNFLFEPKFISLEYFFYQIYLLLVRLGFFGGKNNLSLKNRNQNNGNSDSNSSVLDSSYDGLQSDPSFFASFVDFLEILLYIFIVLFILVISYTTVRMLELRKRENLYLEDEMKRYNEKIKAKEKKLESSENSKNPRWNAVSEYMQSDSENNWKLAILEADTILDSLLDSLGFVGEGIGEKLKKANPEKFKNLNSVWEAHNIRNKIAHEGSDFKISKHEADRVIYMYEQVFRDYNYI